MFYADRHFKMHARTENNAATQAIILFTVNYYTFYLILINYRASDNCILHSNGGKFCIHLSESNCYQVLRALILRLLPSTKKQSRINVLPSILKPCSATKLDKLQSLNNWNLPLLLTFPYFNLHMNGELPHSYIRSRRDNSAANSHARY